MHLIVISPRPVTSPTLPGRDSQCPSPLQSFPSTKSIAGCSFLLGSLSTTAQMLSAADVPSHQLELLFVCVGGDVHRGLRFLLILGGKAAPYPYLFMYLQHISSLPATGASSHPFLLGGSAGGQGDPGCLFQATDPFGKEVMLLTLASPLQGSAGTYVICYGFPQSLKKTCLK